MIAVKNAWKSFGSITPVRDVSFEIEPGTAVGLLGPNGAGKTTTIRLITGYATPDAGSIRIGGIDAIREPARARARVGYLPEAAPLYPEMTPRSYLRYRARLHGLRGRTGTRAIDHALERCALTTNERRRIGVLSKGYKQRVGLAAAILHDPAVLILDEPTNGLDPAQLRETRSLIETLASERTTLITSHVLPEVERVCRRFLIYAGGCVRADGSAETLMRAHGGSATVCVEALPHSRGALADLAPHWHPLPGGWYRAEITPSDHPRVAAQRIGQMLADRKIAVRELSIRASSLEEIFVRVVATANEEHAGTRTARTQGSAA